MTLFLMIVGVLLLALSAGLSWRRINRGQESESKVTVLSMIGGSASLMAAMVSVAGPGP